MSEKLEQQLKVVTNELLIHQLTLDNVSAYIFMKDLHGRYTYANKKVLELFNCSLDEMVGKDDEHFFSLEESNELRVNDNIVLKKGISIEKEERNIIMATGEVRYYWSIKKPLLDEHGKVMGLSGISTDITEQKLLQIKLKEQKILLDTLINNIDAYIYMKDAKCRFLFINDNTANLFGTTPQNAIGKRTIDILPRDIADNFDIMDSEIINTGNKVEGEESITEKNGDIKYYWSTKVPIKDDEGRVISFIGLSTDITKLGKEKRVLEKTAATDELTKLANRRAFMARASNELDNFKHSEQSLTIMVIDVDYFKNINDRFGHHTGDITLKKLSKILLSCVRKNDLVGRIGGEEFAIILTNTELDMALIVAEKLRKEVAVAHLAGNEHPQPLTISIGVTTVTPQDLSVETVLMRADEALYLAKNSGRNRVCSN
jgi:diguanylate cyclase (GGDEF)-like protein/PAS domain S-box-containing protein